MTVLLNLIYLIALTAALPWVCYQAVMAGKYRRGLVKKFLGLTLQRDGDEPCVWFHGVSVGEIRLFRELVARFRHRHPDWECVISTTSDTGYDLACSLFPDLHVFFWPFDFSWAVRRALRRVNPTLVVLAEGELWPNFLTAARARGTPVAMINGRLSPRSLQRWQRLLPLIRPMLSRIELMAVQSEEHAVGYRTLGASADQLYVTGSMKFDGVVSDRANQATDALRQLFGFRPGDLVLIAGSTQAPEEQLILDAYRSQRADLPNLRLVLVPRHPQRFDDVARLAEQAGFSVIRRSRLPAAVDIPDGVILLDTVGELAAAWGLADVAFVGGTLDGRRGGQNMIEPAAYGAAVVFGPHVWNFKETACQLLEAGAAVQVAAAAELEPVIAALLRDAGKRRRLGQAAQRFVEGHQGATGRTLDLLDGLIDPQDGLRTAA